jgi:hypothetical protein
MEDLRIDAVLKNPENYIELPEYLIDLFYEESYATACELVSPNAYEFDSVQEAEERKLEDRFWNNLAINRIKQGRL